MWRPIKCKLEHDDKKYETCRIKYKYCNCVLECTNFKDEYKEYKFLICNELLKLPKKIQWEIKGTMF